MLPQTRTTYTCGEDGHIRAWKLAEYERMDVDENFEEEPTKKKERTERRKDKKEKRKGDEKDKGRFKPY